jgi:hypothetical protein
VLILLEEIELKTVDVLLVSLIRVPLIALLAHQPVSPALTHQLALHVMPLDLETLLQELSVLVLMVTMNSSVLIKVVCVLNVILNV